MKVIGIVGYPASGKSEFSCIAEDKGIPVIVMGDIIRECTKSHGLELTDANIGKTACELRKEMGMDAVAVLTAEKIKGINTNLVIIDGIRGGSEVSYFRKVFENFILICIKSDFSVRLARLKLRNRSDDFATEDFLHNRDERENSYGLKEAIAMADIEIMNNNDRRAYQIRIKRILEDLV